MHSSFVLLAALAGRAIATPCPPWMGVMRSSWASATTRLDSVLAEMPPTMYPGGLTAPPDGASASAPAPAATGTGKGTAASSPATVDADKLSMTKAASSSTISASPASFSSTEDVSVTQTTTTITVTPTATASTSTTVSTSAAAASTDETTDDDTSLERRDEDDENSEKQVDEKEDLKKSSKESALELEEAYALRDTFEKAVLKWAEAQKEHERQRKVLRKIEAEVKRRIKGALDLVRETKDKEDSAMSKEEQAKTEGAKPMNIIKRDERDGHGCGRKTKRGIHGYPSRVKQDIRGPKYEQEEDELYDSIGKQLEKGLAKKEKSDRPIYLITESMKVYKCVRPNGCDLYDFQNIDVEADDRHHFKQVGKEEKLSEKGVKEEKQDEQKSKPDSLMLAGGDEKKQYERISALYMQYRSMLVKPIQKDLDPILKSSKYKEDKDMAAQYQEGNEREQRKRLTRLYMDYRYMLVSKWQKALDPILHDGSFD